MSTLSIPDVLSRLRTKYPGARYELDWTTPLELLVATILAAQCTDERVNRATPALFARYKTAADYAGADTAELEELIKSTGFYRQKAKSIQGACRTLVSRFGGEVPRTMDEMLTLPGVARKTANVVLNNAFDLPSGIIVDTHVARISPRMGLTTKTDPEDIEADLMKKVPREDWTFFGPAMVLHGRYTCTAKAPQCGGCIFEDKCPKNLGGIAPGAAAASRDDEEEEKAPAKKTKASGAKKAQPAAASAKATSSKKSAPSAGAAAKSLAAHIPAGWREVLGGELDKPYFHELERFLAEERKNGEVFPPEPDVFSALTITPYERVNVLLLGQDPYHDDGQAHGLCFSVRPGIKPPPSLVNMYKELSADLGISPPKHGYLVRWAEQGILMLNAVLTVRAHSPNSHKDRGWENFTDAVIRAVNDKSDPVVFVLWGGYAQKKAKLIDSRRHVILKAAHPSPLSANNGFFGSKPFSSINKALREAGKSEIDWELPDP